MTSIRCLDSTTYRASTVAWKFCTSLAVFSCFAFAGSAQAQSPHLDAAIEAYEQGEFATARDELGQAQQEDTLDRSALLRLLVHRVLVAQPLGDDALLETALLQLASLDRDALDGRAPPALMRRFEAAIEQAGESLLAVDVDVQANEENVVFGASARGDIGALVERISLRTRLPNEDWLDASGNVATHPRGEVEYVAQAIGPGGAVLAEQGNEAAPIQYSPDSTDLSLTPAARPRTRNILIGVAAALVVIGATLAIILVSRADDNASFAGPPVVSW
ncbi:MAG: hypothetical protein ACI9KE_004601 [Polyangiales bacterium]|jgi:hypothetical protein